MTGLVLAALTVLPLAGTDADAYADAHKATLDSGKPLMVMVGAEWCQPCQRMKRQVLPLLRQRGAMRKIVFAYVDPDHDAQLAQQLTGGGPIPQLVVYRKDGDTWSRKKLVGGQTAETVEKFINEAADGKTDGTVRAAPPRQETP